MSEGRRFKRDGGAFLEGTKGGVRASERERKKDEEEEAPAELF
jgi:hypothetical protein